MKVIDTQSLKGTDREVFGKGFISMRILLEKDNMGFSLHKTIIPKGGKENWHYKHHLEACYCVYGYGILTDMTTGKEYEIRADTTYVLDKHDNHTFQAFEDTVLISIFNPPVIGNEVHREDGSYAPNVKE